MLARMTRTTVGLLLLGLAGPGGAPAQEDDPMRATISVGGSGRISAAPDVAEVSAGVITEAESAGRALRDNTEAMAALHEALKRRGVAAKDIQTSQISVQPRYSQPGPAPGDQAQREFIPRVVGYTVSNTVRITVRDLAKLGELLDAVVTSGANQMYGINFRLDRPDALLDEARKRAVADARRKAELLAGEAGVVLGPAVQISESGGAPSPPMPMFRGGMEMMAAPAAVPVAPGEQELEVSVQIVYRIDRPQ